MNVSLNISKLDAARRQLETAIRLYFSNCDLVSIHTLAAAAYNILRDINKNLGRDPLMLKEQLLDNVKPAHKDEAQILINEAENFFKHADRDPNKTLSFSPEQSDFMLYEACSTYKSLTNDELPLLRCLEYYFFLHHQNIYDFPDGVKAYLLTNTDELMKMSRAEFFKFALVHLTKIHA